MGARKRNQLGCVGCGGLAGDLEVKVLYTNGKRKCAEARGKAAVGDYESEGSTGQNAGLMNRKRIEATQQDEPAKIVKARHLHGTL